MNSLLEREDAFTIHELVVVIIIGSTAVMLAVSLYLTSQRAFSQWKEAAESKMERQLILSTMERDLAKADNVISGESTWIITVGYRRVTYTVDSGRILREGLPMTPPSDKRWSLQIVPVAGRKSGYQVTVRHFTDGNIQETTSIAGSRRSGRSDFELGRIQVQ